MKLLSKLEFNYYSWWVGGGWVRKKTKLMPYSTLVVVVVEVEVELGNMYQPSSMLVVGKTVSSEGLSKVQFFSTPFIVHY